MTEQDESRKKVARILHKTIRQFEVEKCPKVFDLRVHIDRIQALYSEIFEAGKKEGAKEERERIQKYIQVLVNSNDLKINDGVLLYNIIQDALPLKYMQVPLVAQVLKEAPHEHQWKAQNER